MRKESADEVAEVARRRLAELGRELARTGYPTVGASAEPDLEPVESAPVVEQRAQESAPVVEQRARESAPVVEQRARESAPVVEQRARERSVETTPRHPWSHGDPGEPPARAIAAPVPIPGRHARHRPPTSDRGVALLLDRLPATLQGRVSLGAGHVAVLAVVAALALTVTAYALLRGRPTVTPVP